MHSELDLTPEQRVEIVGAHRCQGMPAYRYPRAKRKMDISWKQYCSQCFFTQGSSAYKTLNALAQSPTVMSMMAAIANELPQTKCPSMAATVFFAAAEAALKPLVEQFVETSD